MDDVIIIAITQDLLCETSLQQNSSLTLRLDICEKTQFLISCSLNTLHIKEIGPFKKNQLSRMRIMRR